MLHQRAADAAEWILPAPLCQMPGPISSCSSGVTNTFSVCKEQRKRLTGLACFSVHALRHTATTYHARQVGRVESLQDVLYGQAGLTLQDGIHQMSVPAMMLIG